MVFSVVAYMAVGLHSTEKMNLRPPKSETEFNDYYDLRWKVLRKPWGRPKGSEKDNFEDIAFHIGVFDENRIIGVGRIHPLNEGVAQIRYMAVLPEYRGQGIGARIIASLEKRAIIENFDMIELNSRDKAVTFYLKQGYTVTKKGHVLYGEIPHAVMKKSLLSNKS